MKKLILISLVFMGCSNEPETTISQQELYKIKEQSFKDSCHRKWVNELVLAGFSQEDAENKVDSLERGGK